MEKQNRAKAPQDAVALLIEDHKKVLKMFKDYARLMEQGADGGSKGTLCKQICDELTIHDRIEEELFYPAARAAIDDDDMMDEAEVEHAGARDLIGELETMEPGDDLYDAKVTVLGENIGHHAKEEQDEMFPAVKKTELDLQSLGEDILERKKELQAEMGLAAGGGKDEMPAPAPAPRGGKKPAAAARK